MLQIITGKAGEGKTKKMVALANEEAKKITGDVVYIDSSKQKRYDLSYHVRLIKPFQFNVDTVQEFYGFIAGIISANHDTQLIFIDELFKLTGLSVEEIEGFISNLKGLSNKYNVRFVIAASCLESDLPEELRECLIA
ncbi:MAG: ATP-binding protein [Epulopiscium sp.]|nr:ATP-binding protein [Candidatus Epulonipiscium sp.]